jgi:shikimate dehydrogenase
MKINGKTKILGIIGRPVEHSLSPVMHNAAIMSLGLDYVYVPFHVETEDLGAAVNGLRALGVKGFNVTIPHKTAVMSFLDKISPEAELSGAVNTVSLEKKLLVGHNTDGTGLLKSLREDLNFDPSGASVLLLGAGGAARGALAALCMAGVSRVIVANRTESRGQDLMESFRKKFNKINFRISSMESGQLEENLKMVDILLNTTSVGMNGTAFDGINFAAICSGAVVYDMVYSPPVTPLLAAAAKIGIKCANGIGMLAAQGEAAFSIWTGQEPPEGFMKNVLMNELQAQLSS